ncbi:MAG: sigma-54-dependent Fis family transcriptional regulator [Gammaproteobacteria bacterium]|nr:sigma-54-dependent Fis family transcriptional regulator [Gammaproteobacteria bacterium]
MRPYLLIIEDDPIHADLLAKISQESGFQTKQCYTLACAEQQVNHVDAIVMDLRLPDGESIDLLRELRQEHPNLPVLLITGYANAENTREAFHLGVQDVLLKPLELAFTKLAIARLKQDLQQKFHLEQLNAQLNQQALETQFVCTSDNALMQQTLQLAMRVSQTDLPILLNGESGVGKSLLANHIHQNSSRKQAPFFTINCAALPSNTLEAELFGYEKGAFTGAVQRKLGLLELAQGGTLFLDEINSASYETQTRLLQFIQEKTCLRLGGTQTINIDTRLIFAANKPLEQAVQSGYFREDLFFRINTFPITIPPLRQRKEDIPRLIHYFLRKHSAQINPAVKGIDNKAITLLSQYHWPGNVRELESQLQRSLILCNAETIQASDLQITPKLSDGAPSFPWSDDANLETVTDFWIQYTLEKHRGNKSQAAKQLGIDTATLWRKMKKQEQGLLQNSDT